MISIKKFYTDDEVQIISNLFSDNSVQFEIKKQEPMINYALGGSPINQEVIELFVMESHFDRAKQLLNTYYENIEIPTDSYLHEFSEDELYDILIKPDEWNEFDVIGAKKLLTEKGLKITDSHVKKLFQLRVQALKVPERGSHFGLIFGYLFAISGGIFGMIIGTTYMNSKKQLPTGEKVPKYDTPTIAHGKKMTILGVFGLALVLAQRFL